MEPSVVERARSAVREQAASRGATQRQIAALLRLHPSQITRRMNGDTDFTLTELGILAAKWDVPLSTLLSDEAPEGGRNA